MFESHRKFLIDSCNINYAERHYVCYKYNVEIFDSNFTETIATETIDTGKVSATYISGFQAVTQIYSSKNLDVAPELFRCMIWYQKQYELSLDFWMQVLDKLPAFYGIEPYLPRLRKYLLFS